MTEAEWLASTDPAAMLKLLHHYGNPHLGAAGSFKPSDRKLRLFACACCRQVWPHLADERSRRAIEVAERFADGEATEQDFRIARSDSSEIVHGWPLDRRNELEFYAAWAVRWLTRKELRLAELLADSQSAGLKAATQASLLRDIIGNPFRPVALDPAWLTPTVLALAQAAYEERARKCGRCKDGRGWDYETGHYAVAGNLRREPCPDCHGTGHIDDGILDSDRLAVLADALEDAGCDGEKCKPCNGTGKLMISLEKKGGCEPGPDIMYVMPPPTEIEWTCSECDGTGHVPHPFLVHLRSPGPHVRGCHVLDLLLGKE